MTKIILNVGDPETGHSMVREVQEPFDRVVNIVAPLEAPNSALQGRDNLTLTLMDGNRVFVHPQTVALIEEVGNE